MTEITDARNQLMVNAAKLVREAIVERATMLQEHIAKFDAALADEGDVHAAALSLIIMAGLIDPVQNEIKKYVEADQLLQSVE